tara:strand:- start:395 stop:1111 length:717 start_codon:yes stop_codon:yes gene_type:complete
MSLLPKLNNVPKYNVTIPSISKEVSVRPFLVKEEKIMLIALESQDPKQIAGGVLDTVKSCIIDDVDVDSLTSYDVEYLFLQLRCKSVGENTELLLKCSNCQHENKVGVNLNDIKMGVRKIENRVKITDDIMLEMKHPSFVSLANNENITSEKTTTTEQIFSLIKESVISVINGDDRIDMKEVKLNEFQEFLESMTQEQFSSIRNYIENIPKLSHDINFNCEKCNESNKVTVEGLQSFL